MTLAIEMLQAKESNLRNYHSLFVDLPINYEQAFEDWFIKDLLVLNSHSLGTVKFEACLALSSTQFQKHVFQGYRESYTHFLCLRSWLLRPAHNYRSYEDSIRNCYFLKLATVALDALFSSLCRFSKEKFSKEIKRFRAD